MGWRAQLLVALVLGVALCGRAQDDGGNMVQKAPEDDTTFHKKACAGMDDCSLQPAYPDRADEGGNWHTEKRHRAEYRWKDAPPSNTASKADDSEDMNRAVHGVHKSIEGPPGAEQTAEALEWVRKEARRVALNASSIVDGDEQGDKPSLADLKAAKKEFEAIKDVSESTVKRLEATISGKPYDKEKHSVNETKTDESEEDPAEKWAEQQEQRNEYAAGLMNAYDVKSLGE